MSEEIRRGQAPALDGFRERAIREAQRYGSDPWIFVRELLQNARDAGATKVEFFYKQSDRHSELSCIDNGEGMAWSHAQAYLFSLYTSSKEDEKNKAGRFGVGFWSILRFSPSQIVIRSKPRGARVSQGWGLTLDGQLRRAKFSAPAKKSGTQILLSRPSHGAHDAQRVFDAVRSHGRFLMQRDNPSRALPVSVNGVCINEPFSLPEPSLSFSSRGIRGVVALAPHGKVELFSRGLRVRSAATLDDLVSSQPPKSALPDGLNVAPQVLLDCDNVQVLLHRSDVRENADLNRALALTRRHLRRLVQAQLSGVRPPGALELVARGSLWLKERSRTFYAACSLGLMLGLSALYVNSSGGPSSDSMQPSTIALGSMRALYRGPTVDHIESQGTAQFDLSYSPPDKVLHFRQFSISDLQTMRPDHKSRFKRYEGVSCRERSDCVQLSLPLSAEPSLDAKAVRVVNLVEATGYRIDPTSLTLSRDAQSIPLRKGLLQDQHADPWLRLKASLAGELRYQMAPAPSPQDLDARALVQDPDFDRHKPRTSLDPAQAQAWVAKKVRYALDEETAKAHADALEQDQSVFARGLGIKAGDCDVQNAILAALLRDQGYRARLAFGYVGRKGSVGPVAHAWSEFRRSDSQPWSIADASVIALAPGALLSAQGPLPSSPTQDAEQRALGLDTGSGPSRFGWWWVACGLCLIAIGALLFWRSRTQESSVDKSQKRLVDLLLSALERPAAFSDIPGVFRRRLVSRLGKGPISLRHLKEAHRFGRLWQAGHAHAIAQAALAWGDDVLDLRCPVARAVAEHLQVQNLDRWQSYWEARCPETMELEAVNASLRYIGAPIQILASSEIQGEPESIHFGARPLQPSFASKGKLEVPCACLVFYDKDSLLIRKLSGPDGHLASYDLIADALRHIAIEKRFRSTILDYVAGNSAQGRESAA